MSTTSIVRSRVAVAVTALALLGTALLCLTPPAGATNDPSAAGFLEGALKPAMQMTLKKKVPGIVVTKVTCFVPTSSSAVAGTCIAKFAVAKYRLVGVYRVNAKLDDKARLSWTTSSVSCSDAKTHAKVKC
jgi:hypothetical protein